MQIKTIMRYHFIHTRIAIKAIEIIFIGKDAEKLESSYIGNVT